MTRNPSRSSIAAVIRDVIRLERKVWRAAQERDVDEFTRLVPADAVMIFQSGVVPQPEYVRTMPYRTISRYKLARFRGFMPNSETVILIYQALRLGRFRNERFPSVPVIESTTWIKRGRTWVAILNQETPIREQKKT